MLRDGRALVRVPVRAHDGVHHQLERDGAHKVGGGVAVLLIAGHLVFCFESSAVSLAAEWRTAPALHDRKTKLKSQGGQINKKKMPKNVDVKLCFETGLFQPAPTLCSILEE